MFVAAVSYAVMVLVMVAAPIAMVYVCGHTTEAAAFAIQWHIVAMFAPSFVTGTVISKIGANLTAAIGLLLIIAAAAVNLNGITVLHFSIALVLLGVGWNFGFIASTAMLSSAYRASSEFKPENFQRDPDNRLLWRMNRRRLDIEACLQVPPDTPRVPTSPGSAP